MIMLFNYWMSCENLCAHAKFQILWEGHKIWKKSPPFFLITNKVGDFFQIFCHLSECLNFASYSRKKITPLHCGTSFDDVIRFFQVSCNQWWCSNRSNHQNFFPEGFIVQWNNECTSLKKELKILIHILFY